MLRSTPKQCLDDGGSKRYSCALRFLLRILSIANLQEESEGVFLFRVAAKLGLFCAENDLLYDCLRLTIHVLTKINLIKPFCKIANVWPSGGEV